MVQGIFVYFSIYIVTQAISKPIAWAFSKVRLKTFLVNQR